MDSPNEWWKKPIRFISGSPEEGKIKDPAEIIKVKRSLGFNAEHISLPEDADFFKKYLEEAHKVNFRVLVYFNVHAYQPEFSREHPDWIQRRQDGSMVDDLYGFRVGPCVNSPYREWAFNQIKKIGENFEVDGIFLDGPCYYPRACYCKYCREKFKERFNADLPSWESWGETLWAKFLEFRYDSIAEFLSDCKKKLQEVNPNAIIYMNSSGLWASWPNARDNRRLSKCQHLLGAEGGFIFYTRPSEVPYWKAGATAKLLETQGDGLPTVIFIAGDHKPWDKYPLTESEVRLLIADTVANGANPWYSVQKNIGAAAEMMKFIEEHEYYYEKTTSAAKVGLVWSSKTADFYGSEIPEIDFLPPGLKISRAEMLRNFSDAFYGFYEALLRSHIPFDILDDASIEGVIPEKYEVIVLPNVACMSDKGVKYVAGFAERGGHVVATFETSLYNEYGIRRNDFALSEHFGSKFAGKILGPYQWDYIYLRKPHPLLEGITLDDIPAPTLGIALHTVNAESIAIFREKAPGRYLSLQPLSKHPAITVNKYGEGLFIHMAGAFDSSYWTHKLREHRLLLSNSVRLKRDACPISLENAPQTLEITFRKKGDCLIIHFVNFTGEMSRPFENILPATNVKVEVYGVNSAKEVRALWSNEKLKFTVNEKGISFTVPKISFYEVVSIE
jgi:hypothetical protein